MPKKPMPRDPRSPFHPSVRASVEVPRPEGNGIDLPEAVESPSSASPVAERMDRERERRIAGRLHDEVQQLLFGIRLKCTVARSRTADETRALSADLSDIESWAAEAITTVQELHAELSETERAEERRRVR